MSGPPLIRLSASAAVKEKRLAALLAGRESEGPRIRDAVLRAQAMGSLDVSGLTPTDEEVARMIGAAESVGGSAPFTVEALLIWHRAATGSGAGLRAGARGREGGPPTAPPPFVLTRLQNLEEWLASPSSGALKPAQRGALVLARLVEIAPFDEANGRVARLAAAHEMTRAGARPPVWSAEDRLPLQAALHAAFQLHTEPLASLLDQAAERALDVMIRTLDG